MGEAIRLPKWLGRALVLSRLVSLCASANGVRETPTTFLQGHDGYKLQGCFHFPSSDSAGSVLGKDFIMPINTSMADQMTAPLCLDACASSKMENGNGYKFVAIAKGRYAGLLSLPGRG